MSPRITCCKDCVPPKRYPGCGANCKKYKEEKEEHKLENEWLRKCNERSRDVVRTSRDIPLNGKKRVHKSRSG